MSRQKYSFSDKNKFVSSFYDPFLVIYNKVLMNSHLNQCCTSVQVITRAINFVADTLTSKMARKKKKKAEAAKNKYKHPICRILHSKYSAKNSPSQNGIN